jgi:transcriptional regulator with XRE-family HTH domain
MIDAKEQPPMTTHPGREAQNDEDAVAVFRDRLRQVIARSGRSQTGFAEHVGIDRSTLSQILSPGNRRLPRVDTLLEIAKSEQVSVDWLLGLSHHGALAPAILRQEVEIAPGSKSRSDERLAEWHREAAGYKIRYVPAGLPDLLRTDDVIDFEFQQSATLAEQRRYASRARLDYQRRPETDMEACSPIQSLEQFAQGHGIWHGLPLSLRRRQLEQMLELTDELYPTFRWFLYDGRRRYCAPMTVFGPLRAALYLGGMFLVLTGRDHVRSLTEHFDSILRIAVVQPHEIGRELERQLSRL